MKMHRLHVVLLIGLFVAVVGWMSTAYELHKLHSSLKNLQVNTATISVVDAKTGEPYEVQIGAGPRVADQIFPRAWFGGGSSEVSKLTWAAVEPWTVRVKTPTSEWTDLVLPNGVFGEKFELVQTEPNHQLQLPIDTGDKKSH